MVNLLDNFRFATLPPAAEAFRAEVRSFLADAMPFLPADQRARSWTGFDAAFSRRLAARGWVGSTLPAVYGGAALDPFSRFVLVEELLVAGAPVAGHWIADRQGGPLILRYGTPAQKSSYLPRICAGEAFFCTGMTEPDAGSDLAAVTTRATPVDGGGWRLDGRKVWVTHAQNCHFMIVLARTSGGARDREAGLSQFVVDLSLAGISIRPVSDLAGDAHFSEVVFGDVALPADALIGAEGTGWEQVRAELAFEHGGPERLYSSIVLLDRWIDSLRETGRGGLHAVLAGRLATHLAALRHLSIAVTARLAAGGTPLTEAALVKDIGTAFEQAIPEAIEAVLGARPDEDVDSELLRTAAYLGLVAPTYSLRGGTREILRGLIAHGLGLY